MYIIILRKILSLLFLSFNQKTLSIRNSTVIDLNDISLKTIYDNNLENVKQIVI